MLGKANYVDIHLLLSILQGPMDDALMSSVDQIICPVKIQHNSTKLWKSMKKVGWDGVDWIDMAQDRDQWRALVNTVLNLRVP
jgi:hypothetical protein